MDGSGLGEGTGAAMTEWALHMPARGSVYVVMRPSVDETSARQGSLRAGTREFSGMTGRITESWIANSTDSELAPDGRLVLSARFVATVDPSSVEDES